VTMPGAAAGLGRGNELRTITMQLTTQILT
jgi:hypothetical protein